MHYYISELTWATLCHIPTDISLNQTNVISLVTCRDCAKVLIAIREQLTSLHTSNKGARLD